MFSRTKVALALAVVCISALVFGCSQTVETVSWAGKTVICKTNDDTKLSDTPGQDRQVLGTLKGVNFEVLKEQGPWIMVGEKGVEGWAPKEKFVLLEDAVAYFTQRIGKEPKDTGAWGHRAVAWELKGEWDNALKDITEAIRLEPKESTWYHSRGFFYLEKKDYDRAIADFNEAIRLSPNHLNPNLPTMYISRGAAYGNKKDYDRAIADYNEAIRLDPKYPLAFYNKACCYALTGKKDLAIENLGKALELGYRDFKYMEKDSDLDSIRDDPGFKELLKKYGK